MLANELYDAHAVFAASLKYLEEKPENNSTASTENLWIPKIDSFTTTESTMLSSIERMTQLRIGKREAILPAKDRFFLSEAISLLRSIEKTSDCRERGSFRARNGPAATLRTWWTMAVRFPATLWNARKQGYEITRQWISQRRCL